MKKYSRRGLYAIVGVAAILVLVLVIASLNDKDKTPKENAKKGTEANAILQGVASNQIVMGYAGVVKAIDIVQAASRPYNAIGTNVEDVLVGQRVAGRDIDITANVGNQVKASVDDMNEQSWRISGRTKMSDGDYETLLAVVEAEAGGEDVEGRMMVANVILNRVKYPEAFPNNVTDVVWERVGGSAQFSPTMDGRISRVTISDKTREAVNRVIDGEDLSQGALFFMAKALAEEHNQKWFNGTLKFIFEHGVHSFYTY